MNQEVDGNGEGVNIRREDLGGVLSVWEAVRRTSSSPGDVGAARG